MVTGGSNKSKSYIYLENTFVCAEHDQAFLDVDNIRVVYDFVLDQIIGWYSPNAE